MHLILCFHRSFDYLKGFGKCVDNGEFYIKAYLQKDDTAGETIVYLAGQVEFTSYNLGAAVADAQSFTANVRFSGNDPMIYTKVIPTT